MRGKKEHELRRTPTDTTRLSEDEDLGGESYSLEDILEEFGDKEEPLVPKEAQEKAAVGSQEQEAPMRAEDEEKAVSELISGTVDAVREEEKKNPSAAQRIQAASRQRKEKKQLRHKAAEADFFHEESTGEETPDVSECCATVKAECILLRKAFYRSLLPSTAAVALIALQQFAPLSGTVFSAASAALALLAVLLAWPVVKKTVHCLSHGVVTATLFLLCAGLVGMLEAVLLFFSLLPEQEALAALTAPAMSFAVWGEWLLSRARWDSLRMISGRKASYSVISGDGRILKQWGMAEGFVRRLYAEDEVSSWQRALLPVIFAATPVFSVLAAVAHGNMKDFLHIWAALLAMTALFAMPLSVSLPFARLSRRLSRNGVALAGYHGAELLHHSRRMVLTDKDIFPAGTVHLGGIKVYGEEMDKVLSYAAAMAHRSGSGIAHIFDELLHAQGGRECSISGFSFSEYGGYSGIIGGETVVLGTERYLRHLQVTLPKEIRASHPLFLAADGELIAAFSVKYSAISTVDWAIHNLRRNRIVPLLAGRDPQLTPALLKEYFHTDARAAFPKLADRLRLSDESQLTAGSMGACLYREGLMPYAEAVIASRRLVAAAKSLTWITLGASTVGALLAFYLAFTGNISVLSPQLILIYQLLLTLITLLLGRNAEKY